MQLIMILAHGLTSDDYLSFFVFPWLCPLVLVISLYPVFILRKFFSLKLNKKQEYLFLATHYLLLLALCLYLPADYGNRLYGRIGNLTFLTLKLMIPEYMILYFFSKKFFNQEEIEENLESENE